MPYPDIEISRKDLTLATVHAGIVATASVVAALLYQGSDSSPLLRVANILIIVAVVYIYIRTGIPGVSRETDGFRIDMIWFFFGYPVLYMLSISVLYLLLLDPSGPELPEFGLGMPIVYSSFFLLFPISAEYAVTLPVMYPMTGVFWCVVFSVARGVGLLTDRWYPT